MYIYKHRRYCFFVSFFRLHNGSALLTQYPSDLILEPQVAMQEKNIVHSLWVKMGSAFLYNKSAGMQIIIRAICERFGNSKKCPACDYLPNI